MAADKTGTDWNRDELDAIVADYFAMLGDELAGRTYVKSHRRAALMERIGRSSGSIEYKHQNISAVLQEVGLPWIWGYKPALNYQAALSEAIERYRGGGGVASLETEIRYEQPTFRILQLAENENVFIETPTKLVEPQKRPEHLNRIVRKFDPVERDFRNRQLGKSGEEFVLDVERHRLEREKRSDLAGKVRWVAHEDGDGAGYYILSFEKSGQERLIEVKTTNGALKTPFFMTRNERSVAEHHADVWQLYRVHLFAQKPAICALKPPLEQALDFRTEVWRANFR